MSKDWITTEQIHHIMVEVNNGRGNHGDFLKKFATAYLHADDLNAQILKESAKTLIVKYKLDDYLQPVEEDREKQTDYLPGAWPRSGV